MASIQSSRWPGFTLPSRHVVPWEAPLILTNDDLRQPDNARMLQVLIGCGDVIVTYDPDPVTAPDKERHIEAAATRDQTIQTYDEGSQSRPLEASAIQHTLPQNETAPDTPRLLEASAILQTPPEPEAKPEPEAVPAPQEPAAEAVAEAVAEAPVTRTRTRASI